MVKGLGETLQVIERHKNINPQFSELLDILGEILILREGHRKKITKNIFPIDEGHLEAKLQGGLPLVDFSSAKLDLEEPKKFFIALLEIGKERNPVETEQILKDIEDGKLNYEEMVYDSFAASGEESPAEEVDDDTIDLLKFFVEESLRPSLEFVTDRYGERITKMGWNDGYCPICGRKTAPVLQPVRIRMALPAREVPLLRKRGTAVAFLLHCRGRRALSRRRMRRLQALHQDRRLPQRRRGGHPGCGRCGDAAPGHAGTRRRLQLVTGDQ
jgi:hypothetical protein